MIAYIIVMMYY